MAHSFRYNRAIIAEKPMEQVVRRGERRLEPGDLFLATAGAGLTLRLAEAETGHELDAHGVRLRLVCKHACGALEFLVIEAKDE